MKQIRSRTRQFSPSCLLSPALAIAALAILFPVCLSAKTTPHSQKEIIAYVFPQDRALTADEVSAGKLTRINYAFANLREGRIVEGFAHDTENLAVLTSLKRVNPALTILISVGGWGWSGEFTDMALTQERRKIFIDSAITFLEEHNLDGLDIDWEYPGMPGDNHRFRAQDKQNYTLLLKELRERFRHEETRLGRRLVLSIATGASTDFLEHTEMAKVQQYVDTVNLMSYDYYVPSWDKTTGHHAPLFTNPADPKQISVDRSVREYEAAGVPASKIVVGVPFYGKSWAQVPDRNHGLFQPGVNRPDAYLPYGVLPGLQHNGYARFWDQVASAPYLYNQEAKIFISYDDPESLKSKCRYVLDHRLGGIMFWESTGDPTGVLLNAIDAGLHHQGAEPAPRR